MTDQLELLSRIKSNHLPVYDCRSHSDFLANHWRESVNIPSNELFERMHELPDKSQSFFVIVDDRSYSLAKIFFEERNLPVEQYIHWETLNVATENDWWATGNASNNYFWRPAPFVKDVCDLYFKKYLSPQSSIYDLASGSGRDSVYLAMQGYRVTAVDYLQTALQRCQRTAAYHNVAIDCVQADLEKDFQFHTNEKLAENPSAIMVCRYLHRPLLKQLKEHVTPGGLIAYHTFMEGSEKFGSPKNPNFLLKKGELAEVFSEFNILEDRTESLNDGRPVSYFVAQKT
ncbi:methyltransferase domain-containing protein [Pleionea sediminis]|uniref:methyltransferase domain-containing protein n=1 Tax=Pleionea sediminis TaxID=2569479 RepID=UPI0013DDF369|nr:methyltransferase domain-containing protein [Pleionea sediminis]